MSMDTPAPRIEREFRSDREIVDQTNELARKFYALSGNVVKEGYRFDKAHHPQEQLMWGMACVAQELLTETEPETALMELEEVA